MNLPIPSETVLAKDTSQDMLVIFMKRFLICAQVILVSCEFNVLGSFFFYDKSTTWLRILNFISTFNRFRGTYDNFVRVCLQNTPIHHLLV